MLNDLGITVIASSAALDISHWWSDSGWWLVIIAGVTGIFIGWQAWETKKAAKGARDSAIAALTQADYLAASERALILMHFEKHPTQRNGESAFKIVAKNYGRVPARIISYGLPKEVFTAYPEKMPVPPEYPDSPPSVEFLRPTDSIAVAEFIPALSSNQQKRMASMQVENTGILEQHAIIYGEISYRDGISPHIRHSRYCFRHERTPFSNIGGSVVTCGPAEYNECT